MPDLTFPYMHWARGDHGMAVVIMPPLPPYHSDSYLRVQCECGAFSNFESPITLKRINEVMETGVDHNV